MDGSATFTTVMSSRSMNVATLTAMRVHHFLAMKFLRSCVYTCQATF